MGGELVADHSIRISIDRGGTFTDVHATWPTATDKDTRKEWITKLLSQDSAYHDGPTEGIRRVLQHITQQELPRHSKLNTDKIDYIRLSTTVATNALLERKGSKHVLVISKGFKDLLEIGNQSRPRIFDLAISKPSTLYDKVVEVDERVTLVGFTSDPNYLLPQFDFDGKILNGHHNIVRGNSGEAVQIIKPLDQQVIRKHLIEIKEQGYDSIAVVLMHSYTYPEHEQQIGKIAQELNFNQISLSSELMPMIKIVSRGTSTTVDAYLTPILREYIKGFYSGFEDDSFMSTEGGKRKTRIEFMRSDGGLTDLSNFSGLHSILSGPAGGVVGYAQTSYDQTNKIPIVGLDMGGTSTDVSRFDGRYETVFETTTAGVTIQTPQLDINTVAAGGGSRLFWRNNLFVTGPESVGADPGPSCYRKGGPLSVTDANLILGRLIPSRFPKIFGPNQDLELDLNASLNLFNQLKDTINRDLVDHKELSLDEVAWGFIKIANETMCRPIRALTEARGYDTSKHILSVFGGAGGQHGCSISKTLRIKRMIIHKHSSILSAFGLALADRVIESQCPCALTFNVDNQDRIKIEEALDGLQRKVVDQLRKQGFDEDRILVERYLNMRYDGTDTALMILDESDRSVTPPVLFNYLDGFKKAYFQQFGFLLDPSKSVVCDDIRVRGIGKSTDKVGESVASQLDKIEFKLFQEGGHMEDQVHGHFESVFFEDLGRVDTPIYDLDQFKVGDYLIGPAILIDHTQTIVIDPLAKVRVLMEHLVIDFD
ncbi:hypothetical protein PSTG_03346 [Puccinia striiformis f. sp. tritici PST-78]|uniref:5-oxoprolinase n=1 Tax=Puccinia striiformis f. sp. tritici PST-78 TaxID=1165861 RepID=A0A0L0VVV8_9BASI|nr:hypothetical protein PSTG_03346 [Puccinia striiformis f. sp. tritici PST-78]